MSNFSSQTIDILSEKGEVDGYFYNIGKETMMLNPH